MECRAGLPSSNTAVPKSADRRPRPSSRWPYPLELNEKENLMFSRRSLVAHALAAISIALYPAMALAHPGHSGPHGFAGGFVHPFTGLDHMLAALAIGIWAIQLGGRARWAIPFSFLSMLAIGSSIHPFV